MERTSEFTQEQIAKIRMLLRSLQNSTGGKQKTIRGNIRKLGFYISDYKSTPNNKNFTVEEFDNLIKSGIIRVIGKPTTNLNKPQTTSRKQVEQHANSTIKSIFDTPSLIPSNGRKNSDESYVIDICDEVLGLTASRQHRFDFLVGDSGRKLPVDAYYKDIDVVVEYCESQHTVSTPFFDNKTTVSGISRGEQRKIYDLRRAEVLPQHGIKLISIDYSVFGSTKKIKRDHNKDKDIIIQIFKQNRIL